MRNTEFILVLLFISYCIVFYVDSCKPTFALLCIYNIFKTNKINPVPHLSTGLCLAHLSAHSGASLAWVISDCLGEGAPEPAVQPRKINSSRLYSCNEEL